MAAASPRCLAVTVFTFQGDRAALGRRVRAALDDAAHGLGKGPTRLDCLLYSGHTGVSAKSDKAIYAFNPDFGRLPIWQGMRDLRYGVAFPGVVLDDASVFAEARKQRLPVRSFEVILPASAFNRFEKKLIAEQKRSQFNYGFPNGDGDCNCITWLERLALPLLSGSMTEFAALAGFSMYPQRRFGLCI